MTRKKTTTPPECPTPDKKRYATREAADSAAQGAQIAVGRLLHPYVCACAWWHLSKTPTDTIPADATANPENVRRLNLCSDATFQETVANDARGHLPMDDRIALRHPSNLLRWHRTLKTLTADVNRQLNEQKATDRSLVAHDWRKRAEGYRNQLACRTHECRDLRAQHADNPAHTRPAYTTDQKDLRRIAGDRAINRLIDAHRLEFAQYLAEECAEVGATVPDRVRQQLADQPYARTA